MLSIKARPGSKNTRGKVSKIKATVRMRLKGQDIRQPNKATLESITTEEKK